MGRTGMDDDDPLVSLVHAAADGDQAAWRELVSRFAPLALSVVRRYRLSDKDTEDVCQTLWLRLVEHLGELREPRALPGWIVTTLRNDCLRLLFTNQRTRPYDPLAEPSPAGRADGDDLDDAMLHEERHEALLQAFAELPEHQRQLLLLLVEDPPLSYREISRRLQIPVGSIGPTRARALQRLRACPSLARLVEEPEGAPGR
jgi:RNA polymerase sigma factor (sigma-70 family)